jgi:hypothetical protein
METSDLEFEHYLAERLGMTVGRLRREMSQAEFMAWSVYYGRKGQRMELERLRARR